MASSNRTRTRLKPISRKCRSLVSRLCREPAERESDLDGSSRVMHLPGTGAVTRDTGTPRRGNETPYWAEHELVKYDQLSAMTNARSDPMQREGHTDTTGEELHSDEEA